MDDTTGDGVMTTTLENMRNLAAEAKASEDRLVMIKRTMLLSELVLKAIRNNPNSGLGCYVDALWGEVVTTVLDNRIEFAEVVKAVNLLLRQGKIRVRFSVNTNSNSVSFVAEKENKESAS